MKKTYVAITGFNNTSDPTNIYLFNNNIVVFNIKELLKNEQNKKIIKIDIDWNVTTDPNDSTKIIFNTDYSIDYRDTKNYRGNMLNVIKSDDDSPILSLFEHEYKLEYGESLSSGTYLTYMKCYTMDGEVNYIKIKFLFTGFDFFDILGDLTILNSQYILNDYNYVFLTLESKTNYIINYCLKQQANRSNAITSKKIVSKDDVDYEQITLIKKPSTYLTTINGYPIYIITPEDLNTNEDETI